MIGSLSLDQLRVLVAVANEGSFSAAGRRLRRAQSAISQSIATLEANQGIVLFDRSGYRPVLTPLGRVLVQQARTVLADAERFEAVARNTRGGLEAELTLAIDPLVPSAPLIGALKGVRAHFPDLPLSFSTEGLGGALRQLRAERATLAVCILLPEVPDDVVAVPVARVTMVPVAPPAHPLSRLGRPVGGTDLEAHVQLVLSDPVEPEGPSYAVTGARRWRFVDLARRLDFLLAGLGWCRMPRHLVERHLRTGALVELAVDPGASPPADLTVHAAHRRSHPPGPGGAWLLRALSESA